MTSLQSKQRPPCGVPDQTEDARRGPCQVGARGLMGRRGRRGRDNSGRRFLLIKQTLLGLLISLPTL